MLGQASSQRDLFDTESSYRPKLKDNSFYSFLADHRHEIFHDDDYASLYCTNNGRTSVPPSILATASVLQCYDRISDEETVQRATYDVRWAVALGTELVEQPFAKSTFQEFRAKLLLNEYARAIFERSLSYAREKGYLKNRKMRIAMDTTHILGKGAVKDTYNLLADGIKKLYCALAQNRLTSVVDKFKERLRSYFGKSFKSEVDIDWDDAAARQRLLTSLANDAEDLLEAAKQAIAQSSDSEQVKELRQAASLLASLFSQDLETTAEGHVQIKEGVAKDRIVSTTDPEMRHGRKSSSQRFDGHKAAVATDIDSQLIVAVDVVGGNALDGATASGLVEGSHHNTGNEVESAVGDCAFGTAAIREQFEGCQTELIAKVPKPPQSSHFTKHNFGIDLENDRVTCPAGHLTSDHKWVTVRLGKKKHRTKQFVFAESLCAACPLRQQCIRSKAKAGKVIRLHPREDLLQQARAQSHTQHFKERYRERVVAEHSIARLVQRGIRKSRYVGRKRTLWQVAIAAAVVNLSLIARKERAKENPNSSFVSRVWKWLDRIIKQVELLLGLRIQLAEISHSW